MACLEADSSSSSAGSQCVHDGERVLCDITPTGAVIRYNIQPQNGGDDIADTKATRIWEYPSSGIVWNKPIRKLINQSHGFFMKCHSLYNSSSSHSMEPKVILEYSKRYRSAMKECVLGLKDLCNCSGIGEISEDQYREIIDLIEMYTMLEVVWHLCEILFLETLPLGCLIQQLLEWVRWHNHEIDEKFVELMDDPSPSDNEEEYWSVIYLLTLHGRCSEVIELLKYLPDCIKYPQMYASISELLKKMPMVQSVVGRSKTELRSQYYDWKMECGKRLQRGDFATNRNLQLLCGILSGDEQSFNNEIVVNCSHSWYEMMVGRLLYCSPLIIHTDYDLHMTAEACVKQYIDIDRIGIFDKLLLAALHNNIINVIRISSSILSDWWFVVHLSSILYLSGSLIAHSVEYGSQLTEFVVVEYALSLFNHPSLWQTAIQYLSQCPTQGRGYIELLIERVPLDSEDKALKVLSVCDQYGLKDQSQCVCRVMARKSFSRNLLGNALTWSVRSKDTSFAAFIAERYFEEYEETGNFKDLSLLDNLGEAAMMMSKKLTFLGKYRQIQIHYSLGEFIKSGELLTDLLESGTIPTKYLVTVLSDTIPLLELQDELVFNSTQTYCLMRHLLSSEEYLKHDPITSADSDTLFNLSTEKIAVLKLSLVRNLQRSLFH